ncbi:hypothetical protein XENTR_v10005021 [Xenopus tropicalis]|nr:hypothetical protein XENTR_v10005021 [Xenopus tropicalis]
MQHGVTHCNIAIFPCLYVHVYETNNNKPVWNITNHVLDIGLSLSLFQLASVFLTAIPCASSWPYCKIFSIANANSVILRPTNIHTYAHTLNQSELKQCNYLHIIQNVRYLSSPFIYIVLGGYTGP